MNSPVSSRMAVLRSASRYNSVCVPGSSHAETPQHHSRIFPRIAARPRAKEHDALKARSP